MNIPADTITELKAKHGETFQAKRAAGLTEQQAAQVLLTQIEHDAAHPPEAEALQRLRSAEAVVVAFEARLTAATDTLQRVKDEVATLFPQLLETSSKEAQEPVEKPKKKK